MSSAERYQQRALHFQTLAKVEDDPNLRAQFESMAATFQMLADHAPRFVVESDLPSEDDADPLKRTG
jgi:hypothetical protein